MPGLNDDDLRWLLDLLEREDLAEIEVHQGGSELLVSAAVAGPMAAPVLAAAAPVAPACPPPAAEAPLSENQLPVLSPMAGVFYRASAPESPPFVQEGDRVEYGDTLGMIEAMKLFNEIPAPIAGTVVKFLVGNEERVEADQKLMIIEHAGR
ncbi:MAG TPA: acetyl-CoA carboxylase [Armatimonadota bacterium]|jgi:acetyl-CoA carboxylase biotin carboxyl carrier protein